MADPENEDLAALQLGYMLAQGARTDAGLLLGLPGPAVMPGPSVPTPDRRPVVAVIAARDEEQTIAGAVLGARATPGVTQVIVVVNGSADATAELARASGATVIESPTALGHDVGRALGAAAVSDSHLLLLDGDMALGPSELKRFVLAVRRGVDVALNDQNPFYASRRRLGTVTLWRLLLNRLLDRGDLGVNSLLIVPAALSARAVRTLGSAALAVPPLAQTAAVLAGLRVAAVPGVDVQSRNRARPGVNAAAGVSGGAGLTPLEQLIIGDHLEAISHLLAKRGPRGGYTDLHRARAALTSDAAPAGLPTVR